MTLHLSCNWSDCTHFFEKKSPLQGPNGYKGIQGPAGIPGPPVRKYQDNFWLLCNQVGTVHCSKPFLIVNRVRRGHRDHLERQEISETKYGIYFSVSFVNLLFLSKWMNGTTKEKFSSEFAQGILVYLLPNAMRIFVFRRAAEVSGAHKEALAKREIMWVNTRTSGFYGRCQKKSTDRFGRFYRVFPGLTEKMAHQGFLE